MLGLVILLLNDFVLKGLYGNWLIGKLSDFAGLFIFSLFWIALFPRHKYKIFPLTGLVFIYWKSPYSSALIELWNDIGLWTISRTIDYTDLIALTVLPISYYIDNIKEKLTTIHLTPYLPLTISAFAFIATSKGPNTCFDDNSAVYHVKHYSRDSLVNELKNSGFHITFIKYHNTKYDDEHSEINNLNDSISNLVVIIGDFDNSDKTVKLSLGCWTYINDTSSLRLDEKTLENQKAYVKSVFQKEIINKLNKNAP